MIYYNYLLKNFTQNDFSAEENFERLQTMFDKILNEPHLKDFFKSVENPINLLFNQFTYLFETRLIQVYDVYKIEKTQTNLSFKIDWEDCYQMFLDIDKNQDGIIEENEKKVLFTASRYDTELYGILLYFLAQEGLLGDVKPREPFFNEIVEKKMYELTELYDKTKTIYVKNGNSFTLTKQDKDYEIFNNIIETACNSTRANQFDKVCFFFINEKEYCKYKINLMNYVWKYVFYPTQQNRLKNKEKYETYVAKINKFATQQNKEGLESFAFDFDNKDGMIIDVNEITQKLMQEITENKHPQEVVIEMQNFLTNQTGEQIHLVKKEEL